MLTLENFGGGFPLGYVSDAEILFSVLNILGIRISWIRRKFGTLMTSSCPKQVSVVVEENHCFDL